MTHLGQIPGIAQKPLSNDLAGDVDAVFDLHPDLARALTCRELPAGPRPADPRQPGDLR